jgi:hypothetical protein
MRLIQGSILIAVMLVMIALVLGAAVSWGPHTDCTVSLLSAKFPMIVGCALGEHEGLSGGLIGAGGALFAGWLAWTGVRDQLAFERKTRRAEEIRFLSSELNQVSKELDELDGDATYVDRIARHFEGSVAPGNPNTYLAALQALHRAGGLAPRAGSSRLSTEINWCISGLREQSEIYDGPNLTQGPREVLARGVRAKVEEIVGYRERIRAARESVIRRRTILQAEIAAKTII